MAKNPDYTESAINLINPEEVGELLAELKERQGELAVMESEAVALIPRTLQKAIAETGAVIVSLREHLILSINDYGSYQDITIGAYAIAQRKVSVTYDPVRAKAAIPDYAKAVIKETVDKTAIKGLLKGKLISQAQVDEFSEEDVTTAYIIKNMGPEEVVEDPGIKLGDNGVVVTKGTD